MTMITPSYLGETIEYSSLHACRSTLEDPTNLSKETRTVPLASPGALVLASKADCIIHKAGVEMPSDSVAILQDCDRLGRVV